MNSRQYRQLYEETNNVKIPKGYDVHHLDHNRENNEATNLICIPKSLHRSYHYHKRYYEWLVEDFKDNFPKEIKRQHKAYYDRKAEYKIKVNKMIKEIKEYTPERLRMFCDAV